MPKPSKDPAAKVYLYTGDATYPAGTEVYVLGKDKRGIRTVQPVGGGEPFRVLARTLAERDPEPAGDGVED